MQNLIKRYFWVLGGVVVAVCAVFAAKATSHVVEAKYLGDPDHGPKVVRVADATPATPAKTAHSKDGTQFQARNMFCAECTPPVDVAAKPSDPSVVPVTSLPLQLLATNIGPTPDQSYATIIDTENQHQGSYAVGDVMPGAKGGGKVKLIRFKFVDFDNDGRTERLGLLGTTPPTTVAVEAPPTENKDEMSAAIDTGIKKLNDTNFDVDKSLVDKILSNPMAVSKGARIVPAMKNGKPEGFKLYAIRQDSLYGKLGLVNGDTLNSINGFELTSADKALEAYTKLREATSLEVDITRHGESTKLHYNIK